MVPKVLSEEGQIQETVPKRRLTPAFSVCLRHKAAVVVPTDSSGPDAMPAGDDCSCRRAITLAGIAKLALRRTSAMDLTMKMKNILLARRRWSGVTAGAGGLGVDVGGRGDERLDRDMDIQSGKRFLLHLAVLLLMYNERNTVCVTKYSIADIKYLSSGNLCVLKKIPIYSPRPCLGEL